MEASHDAASAAWACVTDGNVMLCGMRPITPAENKCVPTRIACELHFVAPERGLWDSDREANKSAFGGGRSSG